MLFYICADFPECDSSPCVNGTCTDLVNNYSDEMTQGDVHKENKDGEQAEEQTEITDVEIEERQEKQNEEECNEKIEQNSNNNSVNYSGKKPKRTVK